MWNKIKNAPYVAVDPQGKVNWIAGGYQNQLGLESQVVAGLCECHHLLSPTIPQPIPCTVHSLRRTVIREDWHMGSR